MPKAVHSSEPAGASLPTDQFCRAPVPENGRATLLRRREPGIILNGCGHDLRPDGRGLRNPSAHKDKQTCIHGHTRADHDARAGHGAAEAHPALGEHNDLKQQQLEAMTA